MLQETKDELLTRLRRFDDLKSHISDKDNRRMSISRPDKIKITADQVRKVKRLLDAGVSRYTEYHKTI